MGRTFAVAFAILNLIYPSFVLAQWIPPVGIPQPDFGINETHKMYVGRTFNFGSGPQPYKDAGNGPYTHYIDNTSPAATDANNLFGTSSKPRRTFPGDLPAGSVVEVHGGPYDFRNFNDKMAVWGSGTASSPIFFRGISATQSPLFTKTLLVMGSYIILENLKFHQAQINVRTELSAADIHHISFRNLEMYGDGNETGNAEVIALGMWQVNNQYTMRNIVVYHNHIHHYGVQDPNIETDWLGVSVSGYGALNTWIVDNDIHHMGGDSIRVGNNAGWSPPYTSHHVYIGRNRLHDNGENAVDVKLMSDVVVSQNLMYNFHPSVSDPGTAAVVHYNPSNVWFLFNEIYNAPGGIFCSGVVDLYLLGNVIHDISDAIKFWGGGRIHIIGNTIARVDYGIHNVGGAADPKPIINNIISDIRAPASGYHIYYTNSALAANSDMHHNLLFQKGSPIRINWGSINYTSVTAFRTATGKGLGSIEADPLFVDAASNNFRLRSGSPAIDAGTTLTDASLYATLFAESLAFDFDGHVRPQGGDRNGSAKVDMGAFEFGNSQLPQPSPTKNLRVISQ
jgi:hypothetical protein